MENKIVGEVVLKPLNAVKPNAWNPNAMTPFEKESLKTGLQSDGWLKSQSLLVWGTDEKGVTQDMIIDGEHRWTVAGELGFPEGPMVFLHGLTEAQAKALTVKMNAKRGKFKEDKLADLLKDIQFELNVPDLALDIGIPEEDMMKMLASQAEVIDSIQQPEATHDPVVPAPQGPPPAMQQGHVQLVQLFFSKEDHTEFSALAGKLAERFKTKNISDTVLAAVKAVSA